MSSIVSYIALGLALAIAWLTFNAEPKQNRSVETASATASLPSYADAVTAAAPAVVGLDIHRGLIFQRQQDDIPPAYPGPTDSLTRSSGSAVVVSKDGYLLTNYHVVADADRIIVLFPDGRRADAKMLGNDPETDLAVLKIDLERPPTVRFAPPSRVRVGDIALAIGYPFGVGQTVTQGIISATGRNRLGLNTFEDFLQTDAAINPGNSGGALINARGELIGISTALFSRSGGSQGIGFAIPAPLAEAVMQQIIANGEVSRGWLGVIPQEFEPEFMKGLGLPKDRGIIVAAVLPNSPAQAAGLRRGDILLGIDGQPIIRARDALEYVAGLKPGTEIELEVIRQRQLRKLKAIIRQRNTDQLTS